jgi:hypothetical protein
MLKHRPEGRCVYIGPNDDIVKQRFAGKKSAFSVCGTRLNMYSHRSLGLT